jgi:hypothetical protein
MMDDEWYTTAVIEPSSRGVFVKDGVGAFMVRPKADKHETRNVSIRSVL